MAKLAIIAHGGAGADPRKKSNVEKAIQQGSSLLESDACAVDAAVADVKAIASRVEAIRVKREHVLQREGGVGLLDRLRCLKRQHLCRFLAHVSDERLKGLQLCFKITLHPNLGTR